MQWGNVLRWRPSGLDDAARLFQSEQSKIMKVSEDLELCLSRLSAEGYTADAVRLSLRKFIWFSHKSGTLLNKLCVVTSHAASDVECLMTRIRQVESLAWTYGFHIDDSGTVQIPPMPTDLSDEAAETLVEHTREVRRAIDKVLLEAEEIDASYAKALSRTLQNFTWSHDLLKTTDLDLSSCVKTFATVASFAVVVAQWNSVGNSLSARPELSETRLGRHSLRKVLPAKEGPTEETPTTLGKPVKGLEAPFPKIIPWHYPGDTETEGSGPYRSRYPTPGDYVVHETASIAASSLKSVLPDASDNLIHYLSNTGSTHTLNVDRMINDLPEWQEKIDGNLYRISNEAFKKASASGTETPVTYPFTIEWKDYYAHKEENANWFYATGGFHYAIAGTVTLTPPLPGSDEWTSSYKYEVHVADRYNWDGEKSTTIGPFTVTDAQLQELHRSGLAREYDLVGTSTIRTASP